MRAEDAKRTRGSRSRALLRAWGRVALACMVFLSAVANAYCEVDRGWLPAKRNAVETGAILGGAAWQQAMFAEDDSCNASDDLSSMEAPDIEHLGDAVLASAQALAFRDHGPRLERAASINFFHRLPLPSEPVFKRVPRLLI